MEQPKIKNTEERITDFWKSEGAEENLSFKTPEEAKAKSDEINAKHGDISFVAEDRGMFAVKFRMDHIGEGFPEHTINNEENKLEEAA